GALSPSPGAGGGGGRAPRREVGRDALRLRDAAPWRRGRPVGAGDHPLVPGQYGPLQGAAHRRVRPAAEDLDRQDPEVRPARAGPAAGRTARPLSACVQDLFTSISAYYHSVVDPLDPFNRGNIVLYFTWIVVYTFTGVAVWRSERSWFRLVC